MPIQVYLPALVGHLPDEVVLAVRAFLDFAYSVRRSTISEDTLKQIDESLARFVRYRLIFQQMGVRSEGFSVPRLHSILHYRKLIQYFGAPNGLCSSITESKHIEAVKKPWRRSNRYNALGQMLKTINRVEKLQASRVSFEAQGMLQSLFSDNLPINDLEELPNEQLDDDAEASDDSEVVEGATIMGIVTLAKTPRKLLCNVASVQKTYHLLT